MTTHDIGFHDQIRKKSPYNIPNYPFVFLGYRKYFLGTQKKKKKKKKKEKKEEFE